MLLSHDLDLNGGRTLVIGRNNGELWLFVSGSGEGRPEIEIGSKHDMSESLLLQEIDPNDTAYDGPDEMIAEDVECWYDAQDAKRLLDAQDAKRLLASQS
jgi:hypothetical protein